MDLNNMFLLQIQSVLKQNKKKLYSKHYMLICSGSSSVTTVLNKKISEVDEKQSLICLDKKKTIILKQ